MEALLAEGDFLQGAGFYDIANVSLVHHVNQALRAHLLFERDTDYIVKDGRIVIIDEFTGRMMEGRRFSEGLHQALEAKEGVEVQAENQTLASITFQNYFRLYPKLAGMTGTAMTEAAELAEIYGLEVAEIPTNELCIRADEDDEVYRTLEEKNKAILAMIEECHARRQPVLVGTVSIEKSEHLSGLLKERKIEHSVLNARYHEQEAHIIAQAGQPGAITIATNMAGRGTDIQLGGNADMRVVQELSALKSDAAREKEGARDPHPDPGRDRGQPEDRDRGRRALRHRHRAPRGAADRQPASRPFRPPGRSRPVAFLPVARRRSDADFRFGADRRHAAPPRSRRGRGGSSIRGSTRRWKRPRKRSRSATSKSARTCSASTT